MVFGTQTIKHGVVLRMTIVYEVIRIIYFSPDVPITEKNLFCVNQVKDVPQRHFYYTHPVKLKYTENQV